MKKSALLAVGIFVALLAVVLLTREGPNVRVGMPTLVLPTVDPAAVTSIQVTGPLAATLTKEGEDWTVADPAKPDVKHPADSAQVKTLLDQLKDLKVGALISDNPEKEAEFEIDAAKGLKVAILGASGPLLTVIFGKSGKGVGTYMRSETSSQVFGTNSPFARTVRKDAKGWRKRSFFPAAAADLTKVSIKHADGSTLSLDSADGKWALAAGASTPPDFRFDAAAAGRVASALASLAANDFADGLTDQAVGLDTPQATVTATKKDGTAITLQVGQPPAAAPAPDGGIGPKPFNGAVPMRVVGDAQVYLVPAYQAEGATRHLSDMRDLTLLVLDPVHAKQLSIVTADNKKTVATKAPSGWTLTEPKSPPSGFEFDATQVMGVLSSLKSIRAQKVAEGTTPAEAGLAKPSLTVQIDLESGGTQRLEFGGEVKGAPGQLYARGTADKLVYVIPTAARARFEKGVDLFRKRPAPAMGGQMNGMQNLPPDVRRQLEAQLRQQQH